MGLQRVRHNWATKWKVKVKVTQSCPTLCDPIVHGILQARILEWVAFPFSRGSSQPRDRTQVSHIAGRFFTSWATRVAHSPIKSSESSVMCIPGGRISTLPQGYTIVSWLLLLSTHSLLSLVNKSERLPLPGAPQDPALFQNSGIVWDQYLMQC